MTNDDMYDVVDVSYCVIRSVVVEFGIELVKIVDLRQPLLGCRCAQELHILSRIRLAECQLVYLLLATQNVTVSLE